MSEGILVVNAGSSSIKFSFFLIGSDAGLELHSKGLVENIGDEPRAHAHHGDGSAIGERRWRPGEPNDFEFCFSELIAWLREHLRAMTVVAIGHRVVHGGPDLDRPALVDSALAERLEALSPLAPLHQPSNLRAVRRAMAIAPTIPNVACFDTAFHRTQPHVAESFALPAEYHRRGVRRYGFHGLSYEYIAGRLRELAPEVADGRVIVAHLGNGASMCALRGGASVASTMGFTALEGLPMGTRCGSIDPGVLLYLMDEDGMDSRAIAELLYKRSGLAGMSGISNDMRVLKESGRAQAALAIDYFIYRISRELGSLAAALGGLDALVFTAGIGENDPDLRERVCAGGGWLGVSLDARANRRGERRISTDSSTVSVWAIPTDEELMIARHTLDVIRR